MRMIILLALCGAVQADVVHVPGGHVVPKECIVEVPNGEHYDADKHEMPANCQVEQPNIQIYASDVHLQSAEPLTSFYADWVVPKLPTQGGGIFSSQVVYFWPGFKAKQPEMGLPVLQPVLQYGEQGSKWMLQSWFVDGNDGSYPVVTAPAIEVSPGDTITSYMNRTGDKTWTVSGTNTRTGKDSTLQISFKKAGNTEYDYAMLVNENINVDTTCAKMPAGDATGRGSVTFTNIKVNGKVPQWTTRTNCKGNTKCDCDNSADVSTTGDVSLGWSTKKQDGAAVVV